MATKKNAKKPQVKDLESKKAVKGGATGGAGAGNTMATGGAGAGITDPGAARGGVYRPLDNRNETLKA